MVVYNRSKPHKIWFIWKWFCSSNSCYQCYECYKEILLNVHTDSEPVHISSLIQVQSFYRNEMNVKFFVKYVSTITSFHPYRFFACTMASYTELCSKPRITWDIRKWLPLVLVTVGMRIISFHFPGCWYVSFIYSHRKILIEFSLCWYKARITFMCILFGYMCIHHVHTVYN